MGQVHEFLGLKVGVVLGLSLIHIFDGNFKISAGPNDVLDFYVLCDISDV